ncbi:MAG: RNA-binding cell elongation regulator Jag/EloR [Bacillota bacterium]
MKSVEKRGRSVEEAVSAALLDLGVTAEQTVVEVLEEPARGLFGLIGSREALVRVTVKETKEDVARRLLQDVSRTIGLDVEITTRRDEDYIFLDVKGDELGILIGRRGQTLDALQYLTNVAASRASSEKQRIVVDVEGYRRRREETLQRLAERLADKVRRSGQSMELEPMSAHERRVIHLALQDSPYVTTYSEGEEPFRKVVIEAKR